MEIFVTYSRRNRSYDVIDEDGICRAFFKIDDFSSFEMRLRMWLARRCVMKSELRGLMA